MQANLHPAPVPPEDQLPPRKRIRKGTRSCWECKHRKVRCNFASDGDQSCRECLTRGTVCRSQDLPEPDNTRESERASINDRLGRLELLLGRVLNRLDTVGGTEGAQALESAGDDAFDSSAAATPANENAPGLSLFDNEVLGSRRSDVSESTPNTTLYGPPPRDLGKLRELFYSLPLESALRRLEEASNSWWLIRVQCFLDWDISLLPTLEAARSDNSPTAITRVLLWVALCLQQLPSGFDTESLRLPHTPARLIAECLKLARSISSDETLVSSTVGLECLVLQGILYNNDGKLRSSWLGYRRALNVAQIIGLHRLAPEAKSEPTSLSRPRHLLRHIIYADRYLSLMLGMNHGITDAVLDFNPSEDENLTPYAMDILCRLAGSINERNQRFNSATPSMLRITQTIDAELLSIDRPILADDSFLRWPGKSVLRAQAYAKFMEQLWYYQLIAWLHLPLFLKSGTERRYDYSSQSCLEASRNMISSYASIRQLTAGSFCCKSLDFQAFTAAVTLLINILGSNDESDLSSNDWPSIETVITSLEKLADTQPPDKVATRGLSVLRLLKRVATRDTTAQSDTSAAFPPIDASGRMKVQIPYFGTIFLDCHIHNNSLSRIQQLNAEASNRESADMASHNVLPSNLGNTTNASTATGAGTWPETHLEFGSIDIWSFDPDLTELPSFLPSLEDDWDLAL